MVFLSMRKPSSASSARHKALVTIREAGGTIRTSVAIRAGIHPRTLYQLKDEGALEVLSRGVYRLADQGNLSDPDLVIVAARIPQAVICLVSALAFHEITTQVPHAISIALAKGSETPCLDHPPLDVHRFSDATLKAGVEVHQVDGVPIKVYCPEKTLADCFKFRNQLGMDIVLEAFKLYQVRKQINLGEILRYAKICRVEKIMRPYLEATL
jgi:predicted transcriptional regulator of viral defense system